MNPRWPHQDYTLSELAKAIGAGKTDILITIPTGGGKTRVMYDDITEAGGQSIVYTDRRMLLSQLGKGLDDHGILFGYRAADHEPALFRNVQLAMVQTESSRVLNGDRDIHHANRVYIDEAHKNGGDTMQQLMALHREAISSSVKIGVTATPLGLGHFYSHLIVGATNSQLRECGALVPAYQYAPDEPDTKWIGKVCLSDGECGIGKSKRKEYVHRVFGSVVDHYNELNPDGEPTIGFAPDVESGIWLAEECDHCGIPSAFISGDKIWYGRELLPNSEELRDRIADELRDGQLKIVWNRFVLREGIDWPWVKHGIFATIFGSLTSYLQAGGRLLRAHEGKTHCTIQDHGGNWWRHGSLNSDREWDLSYDDRIVAGMREQRLREKKEDEPITCPKCHAVRAGGPKCWECGYEHTKKSRVVLQANGNLREISGDIFRQRRMLSPSERIEKEWVSRVRNIRKSKKPTVQQMTFAQLDVSFARDHNWKYAPRDLPQMPKTDADWFRRIADVPESELR